MRLSKNIRQKYLEFFYTKKHVIIPSAPLIPQNDSSTLFIGSGMQPLVPYLLGERHPDGTRLCNIQKSFRAADIEEVGDTRHTTFFEMLGNWSLGDYFKKEQLFLIYEFLLEELKLDPSRIFATVFIGDEKMGIPKDIESVEILKNIFSKYNINAKEVSFAEEKGLQDGKIFYYSAKKNWWSRSGEPSKMPLGEIGGTDSEIFYDLGDNLLKHERSPWRNQPCHVNCDCGRFVEIGNSVFIEYKKTINGFEKLQQRNVDFGGGLERITMVENGLDNIFETDLFINALRQIEKLSGKKYKEDARSFEIIADHLKAATFIMGDKGAITPSNIGQGYILRRLIRRAIRFGKKIGIKQKDWIKKIAEIYANDYFDVYPEIKGNIKFISHELSNEEDKFEKTIDNGFKEFKKLSKVSGKDAFNLYQTYGFPIEITKELAEEKGIKIDLEEFKKELEKHQELSRTVSTGMFKGGLANNSEITTKYHTATHLLLAALRKYLGNDVYQKGSNITVERLRFDFSYGEKLSPQIINNVENFINSAIKKDLPVICEEMSLSKAKELGVMGIFESKYGQKVKVYSIGKGGENVSKEICGGPHVEHTGVLGIFKIQKEESSSSGVRRIKAILE